MFDYETAQYVTGAYVYPSLCIFGIFSNVVSLRALRVGRQRDNKGTSYKYLRMIGKAIKPATI